MKAFMFMLLRSEPKSSKPPSSISMHLQIAISQRSAATWLSLFILFTQLCQQASSTFNSGAGLFIFQQVLNIMSGTWIACDLQSFKRILTKLRYAYFTKFETHFFRAKRCFSNGAFFSQNSNILSQVQLGRKIGRSHIQRATLQTYRDTTRSPSPSSTWYWYLQA